MNGDLYITTFDKNIVDILLQDYLIYLKEKSLQLNKIIKDYSKITI
jgi:hypothetical protein